MKKRFSEEQIVLMLRDGEACQKTVDQLCREHGVSPATYYGWKRKYSSMAERDVEIDVMKEFLEKKSPP
jgi:putative transposase